MFSFFKKKKQEKTYCEPKKEVIYDYSDVSEVAKFIKERTGINFDSQLTILKSKMGTFCRIRELCNFEECMQKALDNPLFAQEVIDYITTNETYFYREFKQVEEFVESAKDKLSHFNVLCAPCATGEEPYSLVIALLEAGIPADRFHITGIDISASALGLAQEALYTQRHVRNLNETLKDKYFEHNGDVYRLKDSIKNKVTFKQVNVFSQEFLDLGHFDYVFSRNMLIYFDQETKQKAKAILESMLKDKHKHVYYGHADLY